MDCDFKKRIISHLFGHLMESVNGISKTVHFKVISLSRLYWGHGFTSIYSVFKMDEKLCICMQVSVHVCTDTSTCVCLFLSVLSPVLVPSGFS